MSEKVCPIMQPTYNNTTCTIVWEGLSMRYTSMLLEHYACNQHTTPHVQLSEQIRPWDTLAYCWNIMQPTNNNTTCTTVWADVSLRHTSKLLEREVTNHQHQHTGFRPEWCISTSGVALTFEKLRIANAQHGKNCVSSPAAKATISTDLPKIDKHENTNV